MGARFAIALALAVLVQAPPARAEPLVADLSRNFIAITSGFDGTEVLLFGTIDGKGDLVIVVRGPDQRVVVRRKDRVAGVWMNRDHLEFSGVPAYYAVASSRPLDEIARPNLLALHQIGVEALRITPLSERPAEEISAFRDALLRTRIQEGLYGATPGEASGASYLPR